MALSKEQAAKIVEVIAADANCCHRIGSPPTQKELASDPTFVSMTKKSLERAGYAGAVRNAALMFFMSKEELNEINCAGIAAATIKPLIAALSSGKLLGVRKVATTNRETTVFRIGHVATWVAMQDGSDYVFDWHATLNPANPAINLTSFWTTGTSGTNFDSFTGM
jgi:hypothetical protein